MTITQKTVRVSLFALVLGAGLAHAEGDAAGLKIDDIKQPDPKAAFTTWTAVQQWMPGTERSDHGYGSLSGMLILADELGDRFSQLGRASLIDKCFDNISADAKGTIAWALCGPDVGALDFKKLEAELVAGGITAESRAEVIKDAKEAYETAKKIGAAVEAAAKDDPGVASVLKQAESGRTEWAAYASKNKEAIDRALKLKDAVRSGKSNNKGYEGCYEQTLPAFTKLVKATKWPWDEVGDPLPFYVSYLIATPGGYVTTLAYAACAYGQSDAGGAIYAGTANQEGGFIKIGPRSNATAKLGNAVFPAPKFAERSLNWRDMTFQWQYGVKMAGVNEIFAIQTPTKGVVGTVKAKGDTTTIGFKGNKVEVCLQWKETNKVSQVSSSGSVTYDKVCKKRGMVDNQVGEAEVPSKYIGGLTPGVNAIIVHDFPVVAWKGNKLTGVFGIAIK